MDSLKQDNGPFWVEVKLAEGQLKFYCDPLSNGDMEVLKARAGQVVDEIERGFSNAAVGGFLDGDVDFSDPAEREGMLRQILTEEIAVEKIRDWQGVELNDSGEPAPVDEQAVREVMRLYPVGERFLRAMTMAQEMRSAAKNGSGLSCAGALPSKEGLPTAKDAPKSAPPVPPGGGA